MMSADSFNNNDNRSKFWRAIAPRRVLFAGLIVHVLMLLIAPIRVDWSLVPIEISTVVFVLACGAAFVAGTFIPRRARKGRIADYGSIGPRGSTLLFWGMFLTAVIGGTLRIYDRHVARGMASATSFLERSEVLALTQTTAAGIVAGPLFPFLLLMPLGYLAYARNFGRSTLLLVLTAICVAAIPVETALSGSRSSIVLAAGMGVLFYASERKLTVTRAGVALAGLLALTFLAGEIFIERIAEFRSFSAADSASGGSAYAHTVPAADWVVRMVSGVEESGIGTRLLFAIVHFTQYYLHGAFELFRVVEEFDYSGEHTLGGYTFPLTYRVLALFTELPPNLGYVNPRSGVFSSILGGMYIDFGWGAPIVSFFYGALAQHIWSSAAMRNVLTRPLYFVIVIAMFFAPVADFTSSSIASYVIVSSLTLLLIGKLLSVASGVGKLRNGDVNIRCAKKGIERWTRSQVSGR